MPQAEKQIAFALSRLAILFRAAGWRTARERGLTPTQAEILAHVVHRGPSRGVDIAEALGVTAATLSDSASTLVGKGLAARLADAGDARANRIGLTERGAKLASDMPNAPPALMTALASLPPGDIAATLRTLIRIIRALQEARAIPVQRMCVTCRHFRPHVHDDAARPHHCAFVDAAFGDAGLRLDCADHEEAPADHRSRAWEVFDGAA
ncbi:MAG: MarR family winged helix-turn-helix transcriptional regulator [Pseudomonadota bacterium]